MSCRDGGKSIGGLWSDDGSVYGTVVHSTRIDLDVSGRGACSIQAHVLPTQSSYTLSYLAKIVCGKESRVTIICYPLPGSKVTPGELRDHPSR